ncbi:MAG: (2Fe-2S)-binding protein [Betaproteobacteria bacterium]|nr:(2Fe-2S)-binding protein [Betaproteobacteria bacterium]
MSADLALRSVRLACGLVLMAFVAGHLGNLILGLHSLVLMEAARPYLMGPWRSGLGNLMLAAATILHIALGLYAIASRRSLTMSRTDVVQLLLGLATPPLLLNHAVVMHMAGVVSPGFDATFGQMLAVNWSFSPHHAFQQVCVVMVVWMHAAVGLYSWLVLKPVWRRIGGLVLPLLFAIPIVALLGFAEAGKEVLAKLAADPAWRQHIIDNLNKVVAVTKPLEAVQSRILWGYAALVLVAFGILGWRMLRDRFKRVEVAYDEGLRARGRAGLSILELSRLGEVPHASVCSGRGRCGTCRVRVATGADRLSPMAEGERGTLRRVGAADDERLGCQARVLRAGVELVRVLPPYADASAARAPADWAEDAA